MSRSLTPARPAPRRASTRLVRGASALTAVAVAVIGFAGASPTDASAAERCTSSTAAYRTVSSCTRTTAEQTTLVSAGTTTTTTSATVNLVPGNGFAKTSGTSFQDGSVSFTATLAQLPTSGALYLAGQLRSSSTKGYRPRVKVLPDGSLRLDLKHVVSGIETSIGSEVVLPTKIVPGQSLSFEASVSGYATPVVSSRAWVTGTTKPAYQLVRQHVATSVVSTSGDSGIWAYLSSTSKAVSFSYKNLAGVPAATTVTSTVSPSPTATATSSPSPTATATASPSPTATATASPSPTSTATAAPGTVKPDASNTGVPAGTTLRVVYGDLEVTTPGTVIDAIDLRGFLRIKAADVTVKRSIIRGGPAVRVEGVVTVLPTGTNFLIQDSEVYPSLPSVMLDGIKGAGFTARRVEVHGGVDNIKVHGSNVLIESSYLHDQDYYASDPLQGGGPTHNDAVQLLGGDNVRVVGNTLLSRKELNAALQVTQDYAPVTRTVVSRNWADGGGCTFNVNHKKLTELRGGISITDNVFGRATKYSNCGLILTTKAYPALSGNRYTDGASVSPKYMAAT